MSKVIAEIDSQPLPVVATPATLLQMAVEQGADIDKLTKLMDLQERYEANEARKAYTVAISEFKANPPVLTKNHQVSFKNKAGTLTEYKHATLDNVADILGKALSEHGLSFTWKTDQGDGGQITVTCTLTHILGHGESTSLSASPDQSGGKNNIQAVGSTITYLERYTLRAITGTAEAGSDDDGATIKPVELIDSEQLLNLEALISDNYEPPGAEKLKKWIFSTLKIDHLSEIRADRIEWLIGEIDKAIASRGKA